MEGRTVNPAPEIDKMNSEGKSISTPKKSQGGRNYKPKGIGRGGKRPGAGRKSSLKKLEESGKKELIDEHVSEMVEVTVRDKDTLKVIKIMKPRILAAMEKLFVVGTSGEGNPEALDKWLNRALGRPVQGIALSGAIDVKEQRVPTEAERKAARAYRRTLEEQRSREKGKKK